MFRNKEVFVNNLNKFKMGKFKEYLILTSIGFFNFIYNLGLFFEEVSFLGFKKWYWKLKKEIFINYFLDTPYQIIKREAPKLEIPEQELIYGETPLITMKKILKLINCNSNDIFYDLGGGRGLTVFFVSKFLNIESFGIEIVPAFVKKVNQIKEKLKFYKAAFIQANFLNVDISKATILYIASTTFTEETLKKLTHKTKELKKDAKIITLSTPLKGEHLTLLYSKKFYFSWGETQAFFHIRN
ncbi:MAG: hypothetical protein HYU63_03055 [Armatimonadetes bacterium]|nr:hypothetical protein [Armatimonadota bacterium]